jgi:hypothetical protein
MLEYPAIVFGAGQGGDFQGRIQPGGDCRGQAVGRMRGKPRVRTARGWALAHPCVGRLDAPGPAQVPWARSWQASPCPSLRRWEYDLYARRTLLLVCMMDPPRPAWMLEG